MIAKCDTDCWLNLFVHVVWIVSVELEDMMADIKCDNCGRVVKHVQSIKPLADLTICDDCLGFAKGGVSTTLRVAALVLSIS